MSHSSIFVISSTNASRSSLCDFSLLRGHMYICAIPSPPAPPSDYWYTFFFFLSSPGPLHEIAVSAFSHRPLGLVYSFFFLLICVFSRSLPYISMCVFSHLTYLVLCIPGIWYTQLRFGLNLAYPPLIFLPPPLSFPLHLSTAYRTFCLRCLVRYPSIVPRVSLVSSS